MFVQNNGKNLRGMGLITLEHDTIQSPLKIPLLSNGVADAP